MEFLKDKKYNILLGGPKIQILLVKLPFKNTAKKKKKKNHTSLFQFDKQ